MLYAKAFSCLIFFFVNGFLIELYTRTLSGERSISVQNHYAITTVLLFNQRNEKDRRKILTMIQNRVKQQDHLLHIEQDFNLL